MGKNMNGAEAKMPSLVELGSEMDSIPKDVFGAFREDTSKRLSAELTAQSRRVEPLAFLWKSGL